jgi:hypothetical protein
MIASPSHLVTDVEVLLRTAEAALAVESRQQFYLWTRLHLHRFVPHDLMLCRLGGSADPDAQVHAFNSVAVPEGLLRQLSAPRSAFWRGLQASWQKDQQRATWLHLRDATADAEIDTLCGQGLVSAWVHGVNATHRVQPEALFVFISRGQSLPAMSCHALAFWQPYLHFAAVRALAPGADAPRAPTAPRGARHANAQRTRDRGAGRRAPGPPQCRHRRATWHQPADGEEPPAQDHEEARRPQPHRGGGRSDLAANHFMTLWRGAMARQGRHPPGPRVVPCHARSR